MIDSLRQVGAIAAHQLRRVALDGAPIWLIILPLVIIYVLGITMHGLFAGEFVPAKPYQIVVAHAAEAEEAAQYILERFSEAPEFFAVDRAAGADQARRAVLERVVDAAIVVTGEDSAFTIIASPGSVVGEIVAGFLRRFDQERVANLESDQASSVDGESATGTIAEASGKVEASSTAEAAIEAPWDGVGAFQYFSTAIMIMFMTFAGHSAMTYSAEERATGAYLRIRSIGVSRLTYLVAGVASSAFIGAVFALLMAVITWLLFRVDWGDPLAWTFITIVGAMSIAALSFFVMAVLPDNPKSVESAGGTVYTILSFLGGSTVPLTIMPDWFTRIFSWLPNRRMLDAYLAIAQGAGVSSLGREFLGLAVATLVLLGLSWLVMRNFKKEAA